MRGSRPITVAAHYVQPDWMSRVGEREATLHPRARLDLELDCVWDSASHGSWLKVPPGKLATERTVPLDAATLAALDEWIALAAPSGPCPIPRLSRPADFLFTKRGRRLTAYPRLSSAGPSTSRQFRGQTDAASLARLAKVCANCVRCISQITMKVGSSWPSSCVLSLSGSRNSD